MLHGLFSVSPFIHTADACSCPKGTPPLREQAAHYGLVVLGEVVKIKPNATMLRRLSWKLTGMEPTWQEHLIQDASAVTIRMIRTWKGQSADEITILTPSNEAFCGFPFTEKRRYVIFADWFVVPGESVFLVNQCGPTTDAGDAKTIITELDGLFAKSVRK